MTKQLLLAGAALSALIATPALAQDTAGAATAAEDTQTSDGTQALTPGDIVVTAQRRSERLQDVPIAISVISGDAISAKGAVNIEGAQYLVPALNFRKSGTSINQSLFLRGVGTSTFSIAGEPSISTVVDGVVYSRAGEAFSDLVDIDRLEVLRGPQGTLFGKNTSAGVINIVTKRPGDTFGGFLEGAYYFDNGNEYRVRGAVDLPLGTGLAARVTGFYGTYDGNIRNVTVGKRVNGYERYGVRGVLVADPTANLQLTLIADYREADDDCCGEVIGTTPTNAAAQVLPTPRGDRTRALAQNLVTRTIEKSWGASLQADWTLGRNTLSYIGSYREYDNTEIRDGDFLPRAYSGAGLNQLHDNGPQVSDTITQEVRLTSPSDQFLAFVLGAYYSRAFTERTFTRNDIVCTSATLPALTPCGSAGTVVTSPTGTANFGSTFKNFALFGNATLNFTDRFRGIAGIRYTTDQLNVFHSRITTLAGPGIQGSFGPFRGKTTNDNWSGRAGLQFDLVPQSTLYGTYARGYKGPAFNVFFNLNATGTNVIEPETADSFEVGLKNTLLDGRLVINVAGFYAKYDNFQANNPDIVAGVLVTRFTNAGEISTRGAELDLLFQPLPDVSISGGLAYTDAKIDQFRVPTNGVVTGVVPPGTRLPFAPEWKGTLGLDYRMRTGGAVDLALGAQGSYQSSQYAQLDANAAVRAATTIKSYGLLDLSAGLVDPEDRFRLTFQVKNVFDQGFAASITSGGPGGGYRYIIPREADRYYGVAGRVNF
jgi:iron complex outermembrane receptor protein